MVVVMLAGTLGSRGCRLSGVLGEPGRSGQPGAEQSPSHCSPAQPSVLALVFLRLSGNGGPRVGGASSHFPFSPHPPLYTHTHARTRTHAHARTAAPSLGGDVLSPLGPHSTLGGHRNACLGPMKDYFRPSTWSALHRSTFLLQGPPAPVQPLYARLSCAWDCRLAPTAFLPAGAVGFQNWSLTSTNRRLPTCGG